MGLLVAIVQASRRGSGVIRVVTIRHLYQQSLCSRDIALLYLVQISATRQSSMVKTNAFVHYHGCVLQKFSLCVHTCQQIEMFDVLQGRSATLEPFESSSCLFVIPLCFTSLRSSTQTASQSPLCINSIASTGRPTRRERLPFGLFALCWVSKPLFCCLFRRSTWHPGESTLVRRRFAHTAPFQTRKCCPTNTPRSSRNKNGPT